MQTDEHAAQNREVAAADAPARPGDPCIMVIFGASGDLTKRKLLPALCNLARDGLLSKQFALIGFAKDPLSAEQFQKAVGDDLNRFGSPSADPELSRWLIAHSSYISGDFSDGAAYELLKRRLAETQEQQNLPPNYLFCLATPPRFFAGIIEQLGRAGLFSETGGWRRVIIEKPFGRDLESARALNSAIGRILDERQVYRIDHYLGKETVQNILVFRFANGIFEPVWNRRYVDHVQVTVAETVGVEGRGGYYETAGALRDMVPNHIFQLITLTAMEPPVSFNADAVRNEQTKVLQAIQPMTPEEVLSRTVRGQYGEGMVENQAVVAYRSEPDVSPESNTETFVAMKLLIDSWRWADVPFYLRTGKRLPKQSTRMVIRFKRAPHMLFRDTAVGRLDPNQITLHLQPDEGISLSFGAKVPGPAVRLGGVDMDFRYEDYFGVKPQTGYERLLHDCMLGDQTLFGRADMVEAAWQAVAPIIDVWKALPPRGFPNYAAGAWGPREAEELLERDHRHWDNP
jgi:glucose-6-phosphate 1-dehydrogenase